MRTWKVGELAKATGLTVRTLHHYDEVRLLSPSHRTAAGHRMYSEGDVQRLQQIVSLRSLGFALDDIRGVLSGRELTPIQIVRMHADRLRQQIRTQQRLVERLDAVAAGLGKAEHVSADELIHLIEETTMFDKYYTPEQLDQLAARREQVGEGRIAEVEAEWPRLMAEVRAEMDRGTDPSDPRVQELARRWTGLVREFTGGDPGIARSLNNLYQNEESVRGMDVGPMREMGAYIARASAAANPQA
ncbi:MerR family transcriptional regulator [Longimicrobium sp.]|jgi:DNA-binding transcriptional MerR regulator|uniref:MerR family transcriptional regulator n=1 Tax=Longimicrobium sp. TaxID=2029185 RepID=UPI002EDB2C07